MGTGAPCDPEAVSPCRSWARAGQGRAVPDAAARARCIQGTRRDRERSPCYSFASSISHIHGGFDAMPSLFRRLRKYLFPNLFFLLEHYLKPEHQDTINSDNKGRKM